MVRENGIPRGQMKQGANRTLELGITFLILLFYVIMVTEQLSFRKLSNFFFNEKQLDACPGP
jgi:hypothetical protein